MEIEGNPPIIITGDTVTELLKANEAQGEIIRVQSEIIDGLFAQLCQYLTVEKMDSLPEFKKMEEADRMKKSMEGGLTDGHASNDRNASGI